MARLQFVAMVLATLVALIPVNSIAEVAKVTSHRYLASTEYQRELSVKLGETKLSFLLNPSSVTAEMVVIDEYDQRITYKSDAFDGVIKGAKNSWARLAINNRSVSGVYSLHGRLYEIKTSPLGVITIEPLTEHQSAFTRPKRNVLAVVQSPVTRIADIAIVVDSQYDRYFGNLGVQKALSIINAVDGIYREAFGLALRVKKVISVRNAENDPFNYGSVPIERMLRNFRDYRLNSDSLRDVSLVHLFSGNRNSDEPVGLAWIDTACRSDGYDVGISTPYRYDVLLAAHEIAHNLGAKHDTETACATQLDKVMWPYISLNTSQNFSSCTVDAVKQSLINSCHDETIDLQVSLNQSGAKTVEVKVRNNDISRTNPSAKLTVELPKASVAAALDSRCAAPVDNIECNIGTLLAGQEESLSFTLLSTPEDEQTVTISVENPDFADPRPLNNHVRLLLNNGVIVSFLEPEQTNAISNTSNERNLWVALGEFGLTDLAAAISLCMILAYRHRQTRQIS